MIAAASAVSRRVSHSALEPTPMGIALGDDDEAAADGVAGLDDRVHLGHHAPPPRLGSGQRSGVGVDAVALPPAGRDARRAGSSAPGKARIGPSWSTKLQSVTPAGRQQLAADRAGRDARCGRACRGSLEHVADVGGVVLDGARQVGVAGARQRDGLRPRAHAGMGSTDIRSLPVLPVAVGDAEGERRAERAPEAQARRSTSTWSCSISMRRPLP